jgi:hypothetical protein
MFTSTVIAHLQAVTNKKLPIKTGHHKNLHTQIVGNKKIPTYKGSPLRTATNNWLPIELPTCEGNYESHTYKRSITRIRPTPTPFIFVSYNYLFSGHCLSLRRGSARYFYGLNTYSAILLQKSLFLCLSSFMVQHLTIIFREMFYNHGNFAT